MKKQSNTPEIRFQNYEDKWDIEKLINIFGTIRNAFVGTATPYYVEEGKFYLESNNVKNGKINYNSQIFINDEFYEKQRDKWLKTNDIVMVQSGHVGHTAVIPEELNNTAAHALIVFTDYKKEVNPHFLNYQFQSNGKRKELDLISTGNTIKHILASEMKNFKMDFPTFEEQSAIGSLFRILDDLLASYKDNLTNYQSLKVTMLSKMFPKAGQTVPEIRLDGFEGEWVEKRLKDISKRVTRKNNDLVSERALTISAQFGLIDQEEFFQKKIASKDVSGYYLIKNGEFAYNKSYSTGYPLGAIKRLDKYENGVLSTLYILFKAVDVDSDYLAHYYESDKWHREVSMCAAEGARNHGLLNIAPADFFNTRLVIPKELAEQQALGAYFSNLDNIINSNQEKITQLETLKKKLLQDMFI
ncbi:restriction endonuclease subunit S [Streptococcus mitis]|uniref:restriction endonuclease subunit S n=1 Tax=Streptococcus mitis TaxID=28037 RepID=UPI0039C0F60C